jgi:hypothetical protein
MSLSQQDLDSITAAIDQSLEKKLHGACACNLSEEDRREMGHLVGRLRDLGDGNLNVGVEVFSQAVRIVNNGRRFGEKVGGSVAVFLFISLVGGVLTLLGWGIKVWIKNS